MSDGIPRRRNTVIWRGMQRLAGIELGYVLDAQHAGNEGSDGYK
jgi:hypothetical protein